MGHARRRHGRQPGDQCRHRRPGIISRLIAGWPALALLIAIKLLSGMLDRDIAHRPAAVPVLPGPTSVPPGQRPARPAGRRISGRDQPLSTRSVRAGASCAPRLLG